MVPPSSLPPFPHSYSVGAKTPSPPQPPLSANPSTVVLVHHAGADTPPPPSITRDRALSYTSSDRDPCIPSSRFIPTVVHLAGTAPTTVSSTVPRRHRLATLLDLLPHRRQPSLPQHRQILSRCIHGAAPEAVLFRICSTYLSQKENRSPLLYSDFLSITYLLVESKHWLRSCLCPVCTFRSAMTRSTPYSQCLWFSPFIFHTS